MLLIAMSRSSETRPPTGSRVRRRSTRVLTTLPVTKPSYSSFERDCTHETFVAGHKWSNPPLARYRAQKIEAEIRCIYKTQLSPEYVTLCNCFLSLVSL